MAKIVIAGDAVVVTSSLTLDDIRKVEKYRPDALILKGGEDNKEPIFAVSTAKSGYINKNGVAFASESHDDKKLAQITMTLGETDGDVKATVADKIGASVEMLGQIEKTLPEVIADIDAKKKAIIESITVAQ